jgi:hypothetical protein
MMSPDIGCVHSNIPVPLFIFQKERLLLRPDLTLDAQQHLSKRCLEFQLAMVYGAV